MAFRFENLDIWKESIEYANKIYDIADTFPKTETFGLISQLRRASASISTNIAEGSGSSTKRDFRNFLDISIKSTLETVSLLTFAKSRNYVNSETKNVLYNEAEKLIKRISAFKNSLSYKL